MATYFAVCGGELSGKTTLCHRIVYDLKSQGINAGFSDEAVRSSYLMFKNIRNENMHLESLLIHIRNEIIAAEYYDVVICDRSALDYLAFANLRFGEHSSSVYIRSVRSLVEQYSSVYANIFITNKFWKIDPGDPMRRGENTQPENVSNEIARLASMLGVAWDWVSDEINFEADRHSLSGRIKALL